MTRPVFEPNLERTDAALGYDKAQLQRRPAPIGSGSIQWIRLYSNTDQTIGTLDRVGVIYPDSVTNNYPDIFDVGESGGESFSVLPLVTGLYNAVIRVGVSSPDPDDGFSLELLGTDYLEQLSGYHSVYYPGFTTGGTFPPTQGSPFTSGIFAKAEHTFMGGPEFADASTWEIEAYISTATDAVTIFTAALEVRRIGDIDFFPYGEGS